MKLFAYLLWPALVVCRIVLRCLLRVVRHHALALSELLLRGCWRGRHIDGKCEEKKGSRRSFEFPTALVVVPVVHRRAIFCEGVVVPEECRRSGPWHTCLGASKKVPSLDELNPPRPAYAAHEAHE